MATISQLAAVQLPSGARRRTEDLLCRVGAYSFARNAYQRAFNREHYEGRLRDREFFARFVAPGQLVFDVGANEGRMAETFADIGARVVAVEPNPRLVARIRARYGPREVLVEPAAVGAHEGVADLRLGRDSGHSTLSAEWEDAVGVAAAERWDGSVRVPVTTLDALIARHGRPVFVKIDVEGFEPQVLAGLSEPVPALSFEFLCRAIDLASRCVELVEALGSYEFNIARGEAHALRADAWTDGAGVRARLAQLGAEDPEGYGDVYARRRAQ
jgi:FkbM family methyltransferase